MVFSDECTCGYTSESGTGAKTLLTVDSYFILIEIQNHLTIDLHNVFSEQEQRGLISVVLVILTFFI